MTKGSAAVLVISDKITPANQNYNSCLSSLTETEWQVLILTVIPQNQNLIKHEIKSMYKMCDIVLILAEETASCEVNICEVISDIFFEKPVLNSALLNGNEKHALVPASAKLLTLKAPAEHVLPVISFQQTFVLRGTLPEIKKTFDNILKPYLLDFKKNRTFRKTFELNKNENNVSKLTKLVNNGVSVNVNQLKDKIVVSAAASSFEAIANFERKFIDEIRVDVVNSYVEDLDVFSSFYYQADPRIRETIEIIEECFSRYHHENVFISFNGGKDCTVLLHLALVVLQKNYPDRQTPLLCWYVRSPDAFPEQDQFISYCQQYYNLEVMTVQSGIKEALATVLEQKPNMKACLMGTRRTDPYSSDLKNFQLTDPDWPQIVRVFPLLDWHYSYIWDYLLYFNIPYCSLYDTGYTSVGNVTNTVRNPSLLAYDVLKDKEVYLPAYKMLDATKERNGRN